MTPVNKKKSVTASRDALISNGLLNSLEKTPDEPRAKTRDFLAVIDSLSDTPSAEVKSSPPLQTVSKASNLASPEKKRSVKLQDSGYEKPVIETPISSPTVIKPKAPAAVNKPINSDALLVTVKELSSLLGMSRSTIIRMEKTGSIPGRINIAGSVRYHRKIVEAWLLELCGRG